MKRRNSGETRGVAYAADLLIIDSAKNGRGVRVQTQKAALSK